MAEIVFMTDPVTGDCALFDEPVATGDVHDPSSARNVPLSDPINNLPYLYFHTAFDYLEVALEATVTINHTQVNAGSLPSGQSIIFGWNAASADHLLTAHSEGVVPFALVAQGDNILWPGMPVQVDASGGARYVSFYCTTTEVRLYEWASIGSSNLAAINLDYKILVFKQPPAPSGDILFDFDPITGIVEMGLGKFSSDRKYLQVVSGGTPFGISLGRSIDLKNGAYRAVRPDGTTVDPVPATLKLGLVAPLMPGLTLGSAMNYNGSYTGPIAIEVQAP